jgi:hypothetical protein
MEPPETSVKDYWRHWLPQKDPSPKEHANFAEILEILNAI